MKSITVYYGPKIGFEKLIPTNRKTLSELVAEHDAKNKVYTHKIKRDDEESEDAPTPVEKEFVENLVAYSESYAGITESAVQSFVRILSGYIVENIYLQNPPVQIRQQLEQTFPGIIKVKRYSYKNLTEKGFHEINNTFDDNIIGQQHVKERLLIALYPLLSNVNSRKPVVIMFYGNSGIGKTETAKYISKILKQPLFRKQLSMFHSGEFQGYLFGGTHHQGSFARDLLERESNVILLDEFDKPHPVFHSAFYQLFDEGLFEDKNYRVELYNSIIICTSNYQTEAEIRQNLGDPIYYRFDKFIKFENLSETAMKAIISKHIESRYKALSRQEKKIVDKNYIQMKLFANVSRLNNVRQISNIIEEYFGIQLVKSFLGKQNKGEQPDE
ncbi:AAA family ATPase [Oscillospiraceae bacterium OttesenSCG-928-G22]|nr:AAA family ATPase [Oscillospiraceae bacterium OttesenSCG-928-G22]